MVLVFTLSGLLSEFSTGPPWPGAHQCSNNIRLKAITVLLLLVRRAKIGRLCHIDKSVMTLCEDVLHPPAYEAYSEDEDEHMWVARARARHPCDIITLCLDPRSI